MAYYNALRTKEGKTYLGGLQDDIYIYLNDFGFQKVKGYRSKNKNLFMLYKNPEGKYYNPRNPENIIFIKYLYYISDAGLNLHYLEDLAKYFDMFEADSNILIEHLEYKNKGVKINNNIILNDLRNLEEDTKKYAAAWKKVYKDAAGKNNREALEDLAGIQKRVSKKYAKIKILQSFKYYLATSSNGGGFFTNVYNSCELEELLKIKKVKKTPVKLSDRTNIYFFKKNVNNVDQAFIVTYEFDTFEEAYQISKIINKSYFEHYQKTIKQKYLSNKKYKEGRL